MERKKIVWLIIGAAVMFSVIAGNVDAAVYADTASEMAAEIFDEETPLAAQAQPAAELAEISDEETPLAGAQTPQEILFERTAGTAVIILIFGAGVYFFGVRQRQMI